MENKEKILNHSKFRRILIGMIAASGMLLFFSQPLYAEENEVSQLRQKIVELERKIEKLEALLKEKGDSPDQRKDSDHGWKNKKNWRRLKLGMTEDQVKKILGEPAKLIQGVRTLWYYPNIYCGYVSFDKNRHLTGWNEP